LIRLLDAGGKIECSISGPLVLDELQEDLEISKIKSENGRLSFNVKDTKQAVVALMSLAEQAHVTIEDLHIGRPNLEDVFLHLTGRRLRE